MPATRLDRARVMLRTSAPWRRLFPNRVVQREVQGVDLYMPWSHILPDYARARDYYGQNLVALAIALAGRCQERFTFIDVGANIGDSALQVLREVDGSALCVEGDPYWARFLRMNVADDPRITVEQVLLTEGDGERNEVDAVRKHGTTRFERSASALGGLATLPAGLLRRRHPEFEGARLIKSDTDGHDPVLVPSLVKAWRDSVPVVFFEFDPHMARATSDEDPSLVWDELAALGYTELIVWDNTGDPLGRLGVQEAKREASTLESSGGRGYDFWDVAACRADDGDALAAFDELVSEPFDPRAARGD